MADFNAEKVFVEKGELLAALYDADAITMDGVRIINQFPAADVALVRHGRWIPIGRRWDGYVYECSACSAKYDGISNFARTAGPGWTVMDMQPNRLPCGWLWKLLRFCAGRKCETCVLRKMDKKER